MTEGVRPVGLDPAELKNLRDAAAPLNPDFDVILRIEPFKVEHDHIKAGMGPHVAYEAPSLLVRGYSLPYPHPKYPDNLGVAGSIFHTTMDPAEAGVLAQSRAQGTEPVLHYSPCGVWNQEPLLGVPFPRAVHAKLLAAAVRVARGPSSRDPQKVGIVTDAAFHAGRIGRPPFR